ncbi:MAG: bifunctional nuclease family protein [Bacteroidetes bacterium]|jgi:bifunctional DNase/RNase|nr:bifunctional nuclease family protein [Bacteroidota bacterium]
MKKIRLFITRLEPSSIQSGVYTLVLNEHEGSRRLPIIIGNYEAQAIAVEMENLTPNRPLTHDLFKSFATSFDIHLNEVVIYNLKEGIFYAKLICNNLDKEVEIDSRTSDAVALAVRFNCPIYTYDFILEQAGVEIEEESDVDNEDDENPKDDIPKPPPPQEKKKTANLSTSDYSHLSNEELNEALKNAIDHEDYEAASKMRDELNRRKK